MIIYLCCTGGLTSSLFCSKIQEASKDKKILFDDVKTIFELFNKKQLDKYDYVLAYGPADKIKKSFIKEYDFGNFIDLVLISPQASFLIKPIKKLIDPLGISCGVIPMITFGRMDGKEGIKLLDEYSKKLNLN